MSTKEIVDTMVRESTLDRPKRRAYDAGLKAMVLQQCSERGASVAGVALSHNLNPNMVHRWIREAQQRALVARAQAAPPQFVPLQLHASGILDAQPADATDNSASAPEASIKIEIRRGSSIVTVAWPMNAASSCAAWLRDWLR